MNASIEDKQMEIKKTIIDLYEELDLSEDEEERIIISSQIEIYQRIYNGLQSNINQANNFPLLRFDN
jgi:hypothetical protein